MGRAFIINRLEEILYQEQDRLLLWAPVCFALGISGYFALSFEPALLPVAGGCVLLAGLLLLMQRNLQKNFLGYLLVCVLFLGALGFLAGTLRSHFLSTPTLSKPLSPRLITGRVSAVKHYDTGKLALVLSYPTFAGPNFVNPDSVAAPDLRKIRLKVHKFDQLPNPGDVVSIRAGLLPLPPPTMPGDFDFARHVWFQGIGAVGYAVGRPDILEKAQSNGGLNRVRLHLAARIRAALPGDVGGLAAALITGMREGISEEVTDNMRNSGLAHLLAISGLHMGLLCGAAFFFCRFLLSRSVWLSLRYPIKKWAALLAIGAGLVYLGLSGGTVPTVRAFIMAAIVFLGIMVDRKAISLRLVAIAAAFVLILNPEAVLSVSFQMSFAAVVALVAAYEKLHQRGSSRFATKSHGFLLRGFYKIAFAIGAMLFTTLIAEMAIAPLALFHFNKLVHYGLLANLLAMPVMGAWVMPCIVGYLILLPFGLENMALYLMQYGLQAIMAIAETVAHSPGAYRLVPTMTTVPLVVMALGGLWFAIWQRPWHKWGLVAVIAGGFSAFFVTQPDIMIDNRGKLIGVQTAHSEISLSHLRASPMTRDRWAQRYGQEKAGKWADLPDDTRDWISCDGLSCLYRPRHKNPDMLVALVKDEQALFEDCRAADIVISLVPVEIPCDSPRLVIDKWDFYHQGAHALWLPDTRAGDVIVETVASRRGLRPWAISQR